MSALNIKKGATVDMARRFTTNAHKLGLKIHADFIIGLPGESRESIETTINFAKELDCETIQVSLAHPYPGTEFYDHVVKNELITLDSMTDEMGHQGNYAKYLKDIKQQDEYLKELWKYIQTDPVYRNKTTLIITSDHGRGDTSPWAWTEYSHGD